MSAGDYYTPGTYTPHTTARAQAIQADVDNIALGFGKLPDLAILRRIVQEAVAVGGTANALTLATTYTLTAYVLGQRIAFKTTAANTGAATIDVNSVGAVALKRQDGDALAAGDLVSGRIYEAIYDGTAFQVIGTVSGEVDAAATAAASSASAASSSASAASTSASNAATSASASATAQGLSEDARDAAIVAQGLAEDAQAAAEAASLPSQAGNAGKVLTTDGSTPSWVFSGWEQLGSTITVSSPSAGPWDFTSIGAVANGYRALRLYCVATVSGGPFTNRLRMQGTSGSVITADFGSGVSGSSSFFFDLIFSDTANLKGVVHGAFASSLSDAVVLQTTGNQLLGPWQLANGGINMLGFVSTTGGATLSSLTFKLFKAL